MPDIARIAMEHQHCDRSREELVRRSDEEADEGFAIRCYDLAFFPICNAELVGARETFFRTGTLREIARVDEFTGSVR